MYQFFGKKIAFPMKICAKHQKEITLLCMKNSSVLNFYCEICAFERGENPSDSEIISIKDLHSKCLKTICENDFKLQKKKIEITDISKIITNKKRQLQNRKNSLIEKFSWKLEQDKVRMFYQLEMIEKNYFQDMQKKKNMQNVQNVQNIQNVQNVQNVDIHHEIEKMEKICSYLKRNIEDPEVFNIRFLLQERNALNEFMKYFETITYRIRELEKNKTGSVFEKIHLLERDQRQKLFFFKLENVLQGVEIQNRRSLNEDETRNVRLTHVRSLSYQADKSRSNQKNEERKANLSPRPQPTRRNSFHQLPVIQKSPIK